ncbi:uncharacterized protein OCT59_014760 [Rhizophagus irregularis]|uniref:Uncharacterized protein n=1 Tax=Rhizophagus irregularis (strain DAOM 181602 / DAOM 197198 / MUCL 43194) TaxID=747089 RepID=U9TYA3_RHIID|nr:hypothetical protein OCT59_014760 [Rhizophagus irregularis]GBC44053.1 retinal-specific ATP-binding cassette transporter [Rhizophagus irregularis DAOM 181602=DAOM 197198]
MLEIGIREIGLQEIGIQGIGIREIGLQEIGIQGIGIWEIGISENNPVRENKHSESLLREMDQIATKNIPMKFVMLFSL